MTTTADSTQIDEAVIDGLRPQARRYDVAVSDELVLAVLPNGAKTWTWVYDGREETHRQTLGVYPEMSLEQAKQALASAARTRRQRDTTAAYVIRDGRIESTDHEVNWKWPLAGAVVMLAAGILIGWFMLGGRSETPGPGDTVAARDPAGSMALDTRIAADRGQPATESRSQPDVQSEMLNAVPEPVPATPPAETATATVTGDESPAERPTAAGALPQSEMPVTPVEAPPEEPRAATPAALQAPVEMPPEPAGDIIGMRITPQADFEPGITDARVVRAQVTTAVVGREPVDALGPVLVGTGEDIQAYYFFTELRSLAGQRVRHRWIANDRIQAEVPFNVGEAWRWRVFSNKRLLASMAGEWRVQVVTDDDVVIYDYAFEFQP